MTDDQAGRPPVPERPLLRGERVWLRPLEERDMPAYVAGINDTEVGGMAGYDLPLSVEQARAWLGRAREEMQHDRGYFFAVCELGDDAFIGTTWMKNVELANGSAELAIYMDRDHIGAGWGTDAQRVLVTFGFGNLGLRRIYLNVDADNARAIRSYEKVGFQREGLLRAVWLVGGRARDGVLMSMLREEWRPPDGHPRHA